MDDLARQYLLVALGVGRLQEGIVDSYYGPPEIAAEADSRAADAATLAVQAARVRDEASTDADPLRARWLDRQLTALETLARQLAGEESDYVDVVTRCFDAEPVATRAEVYLAAHRALDELLPPGPSLAGRVDARGQQLTIPVERLPAIADWLVAEIRRDSDRHFQAPVGEDLSVHLVKDQPWSGYNWYDGGLSSRVEINTDLPVRAGSLVSLLTHETFPGHHLEHAWKEQRLVRELGRLECTVMLVNTPEAYVSEGLAEVGGHYTIDGARWQELFAGICEQAGITLTADDPARQLAINDALHGLRAVSADAALMLHRDHRPVGDAQAFMVETGLRTPEQADKNLEFISHPLWRTYVFCYSGGEDLLGRWCAAASGVEAQRQRFFRLLTEQLTPSGMAAEIDAQAPVVAGG